MISEYELRHMYFGQGLSVPDIAKEIGVSRGVAYGLMKEYSIKLRCSSDAQLNGICMLSKEKLEQMHFRDEMTTYDIAQEFGVSQSTVRRWMAKHNIKSRNCSESKLIGICIPSKSEIVEMYSDKEMSANDIAEEVGVSKGIVYKWMKEHGIESRTLSESQIGKFTGENAHNWHGGISFEPYCYKFNNKFKEYIRERDDYTCQLCGYEQKLNGQKLDVHHIHYDKVNCEPDVVALCHSCNSKVNSNRNYWEWYFEDQLSERGLIH